MTRTPRTSPDNAAPHQPAALSRSRPSDLLSLIARAALSEYSILILAVLYFLSMWPFIPELGSRDNLSNLFISMLPLLAVAIGQTVVLITGGIDLSVTAIISAASIAAARIVNDTSGLLAHHSAAIAATVLAALLLGAAIGLLNGGAITLLGMPPFIVTLSTMMCVSGATLWYTHSRNIANLPDGFIAIAYGALLGIPWPLVIVAGLAMLVHILLRFTLPGFWLYAVGQNTRASRISGVPVQGVIVLAYVISGVCAAVASILLTARLETGSPTQGDKMLLDIIGASVIGGASLLGGKGKVIWTVFGVTLFSLISNSLELLDLQHFTIMMIKGGVILIAAGLDVLRRRLNSGN